VTDPEFLDLEDVLLIHEEQLAKYGGSAGLREAAPPPRSQFVPNLRSKRTFHRVHPRPRSPRKSSR
jgi:hypothetical protein